LVVIVATATDGCGLLQMMMMMHGSPSRCCSGFLCQTLNYGQWKYLYVEVLKLEFGRIGIFVDHPNSAITETYLVNKTNFDKD